MQKATALDIADDKAFLKWLRTQPSCLDKNFDYVDGEDKNTPAHVRRAGPAGTSHKPLLSAVPLTDEQHREQTNHGELDALLKYNREVLVQFAKDWFDDQARAHVEAWRRVARWL